MIILIGEGGSGKTTILNELVKRGYTKAINYTTRKIREDEIEKPNLIKRDSPKCWFLPTLGTGLKEKGGKKWL